MLSSNATHHCKLNLKRILCVRRRPDSNSVIIADSSGYLHSIENNKCADEIVFKNPVKALAFSPKGSKFLVGGTSHTIDLYNTFKLAFDKTIAQTESNVNYVDFSSNGLFTAFCTDDKQIVVINMLQQDQKLVMKGHTESVRVVSFKPNPENAEKEQLVSIGADLKLNIWEFESSSFTEKSSFTLLHSREKFFTSGLVNDHSCLNVCWNKTGRFLVVPGYDELRIFETKNWDISTIIKGTDIGEINFQSWLSSNDLILTTGTREKKLCIWDLIKKNVRYLKTFEREVCGAEWMSDKEIVVAFDDGKVEFFSVDCNYDENTENLRKTREINTNTEKQTLEKQNPKIENIPDLNQKTDKQKNKSSSEESVHVLDSLSDVESEKQGGMISISDLEEGETKHNDSFIAFNEENNEMSSSESEIGFFYGNKRKNESEKTKADILKTNKKTKKTKKPKIKTNQIETRQNSFLNNQNKKKKKKRNKVSHSKRFRNKMKNILKTQQVSGIRNETAEKELFNKIKLMSEEYNEKNIPLKLIQKSFVSGNTPLSKDRRYLVWNLCGSVSLIKAGNSCLIDIEFSDVSVYKPDRIESSLYYELACLDEKHVFLATKKIKDEMGIVTKAHLLFKNLDSSFEEKFDWEFDLPICEDITSVAMSKDFVFVSTDTNRIRVISINGIQREVFAIPFSIVNLTANENYLAVMMNSLSSHLVLKIFKLSQKWEKTYEGDVPLQTGKTVLWVGFNEYNMCIIVGSDLEVVALVRSFDNEWLSLGSLGSTLKKGDTFFPIGCFVDQIAGVVTEYKMYPSVTPKPILTTLNLKIPIIGWMQKDEKKSESINIENAEEETTRNIILFDEAKIHNKEWGFEDVFERKAIEYRAKIDKNIFLQFYYSFRKNPKKAIELASRLKTQKALKMCIDCVAKTHNKDLENSLMGILNDRIK